MSDKPLKTLPGAEKTIELYTDRLVIQRKSGLLHHGDAEQVIYLKDVVQITHSEATTYRANCFNLLIKLSDGRLFVLPYPKKYRGAAEAIYDYVRRLGVAAA